MRSRVGRVTGFASVSIEDGHLLPVVVTFFPAESHLWTVTTLGTACQGKTFGSSARRTEELPTGKDVKSAGEACCIEANGPMSSQPRPLQ
ncbi:hypothetical protein MRX96_016604 [Rhipicephalus microplus]